MPAEAGPPSPQSIRSALASAIVAHLNATAATARVAEVRIGLGYTAVLLENQGLGLAYTFRDLARGGCSVFNGVRPMSGRPATELLSLLESDDAIEAGVGLACANALVNHHHDLFVEGDVLDHLALRPEDRVGMVGYFGPLVSAIQKRVRKLTVFERVDQPSEQLRPQAEALDVLPQCQVALITATTIITHTIDALLQAAAGCREVVLLGPSTPLMPEILRERGVTMASGVVATSPDEVLRVVSEGGGMQYFRPFVQKVAMRVDGSVAKSERS